MHKLYQLLPIEYCTILQCNLNIFKSIDNDIGVFIITITPNQQNIPIYYYIPILLSTILPYLYYYGLQKSQNNNTFILFILIHVILSNDIFNIKINHNNPPYIFATYCIYHITCLMTIKLAFNKINH